MAQTNITTCMDDTLIEQFDHLCNEPTINTTTDPNNFAKATNPQQKILFQISLHVPNSETLAAIDDVNHERNFSKTFHTVAELIEDLNA